MDRVSYRFHVDIWDLYILPTRVRGRFSGVTTTNVWEEFMEREVVLFPTVRTDEPPARGMYKAGYVVVLFAFQRLLCAQRLLWLYHSFCLTVSALLAGMRIQQYGGWRLV